MVPRTHVPAAVALNSMSFNLTRSVGPAIGGADRRGRRAPRRLSRPTRSATSRSSSCCSAGSRRAPPSTLPREPLGLAISAGLRYVAMSPNIEKVLLRGFVFGVAAISTLALLPLVARDIIKGGPLLYGVLLGAYGVGAVGGALLGGRLRGVIANEWIARIGFIGFALSATVRRVSTSAWLTCVGADDRRRELGADAVAVQRHGAALDAALGGRPRHVALPDGDLRRHGAGQLDLGPGG